MIHTTQPGPDLLSLVWAANTPMYVICRPKLGVKYSDVPICRLVGDRPTGRQIPIAVRPPFFFPERESQEMVKGDVTFLPSSLHLTMPNPLTCYSSRNLSTILLQNRSRQSFFVARFKGKGNRECIEEHHSQSALACPSFFD